MECVCLPGASGWGGEEEIQGDFDRGGEGAIPGEDEKEKEEGRKAHRVRLTPISGGMSCESDLHLNGVFGKLRREIYLST